MENAPLVHIGYHKTGTTWLQRRVFGDPDLGFDPCPLPTIKEAFVTVNPFTFEPSKALGLLDPYLAQARHHGRLLAISHERLSGQPLKGGMDARAIAERIHATLPEARVLIVIRDQRDLLLSIYRQITTRGLNRDTYARFLGHRVQDRNTPPILEALEYQHLIGFYQKLFGAERVLVLPYEHLADPDGFVRTLTGFAGLAPAGVVGNSRENVGLPAGAIAAIRVSNVAVRMVGLERWLTGAGARPRLVNLRLRVIRRVARVAPGWFSRRVEARWRAAAYRVIGDRFADSNRETSALTGIDLGALGYSIRQPESESSVR